MMRDWKAVVLARLSEEGESPALHREAIEELAAHLHDVHQAALDAGRSAGEADADARRELDDLRPLTAALRRRAHRAFQRAHPRGGVLQGLGTDVRLSARIIARRPASTALAVLTLALGIGVSTTVFGIYDAVMLRSIPYPQPSQLVLLWEGDTDDPDDTYIVAAPVYEDWRARHRTLSALGIWEFKTFNISTTSDPQQVPGIRLSASLFETVGVAPALGRTFTADEDRLGVRVALLSDAVWRTHFAAARDIVGRSVLLNDEPHDIIGVMPASFTFPTRLTGVFVPMAFTDADAARGSHSFYVMGRLRDDSTFKQAAEDFARIGAELASEHPANAGETSRITRVSDFGMATVSRMLLALWGAAAFVLLIACVNVANLQISGALDRRKEFTVQQALGAGTGRLARQLLIGGVILAGLGAAGGVFVAWIGTRVLDALLGPDFLSFWFRGRVPVAVDLAMLRFAAAMAGLTALCFSFAPLIGLRSGATDAGNAFAGRGVTGSALGLRRVLVTTEVALAVVVLCGAGLLVKSFMTLLSVDPGLDPHRVLTVQVSLPQEDTYGPAVRSSFCDDTARHADGGVFEAVGAISHLPLSGANAGRALSIKGRPHDPEQPVNASYRLICPGYFRALGIPLVSGRDVDARDVEPVVVINRTMADEYWRDQDPVGQHLRIGRAEGPPWMRIVGVSENVRHFGLDSDPVREIFVPYRQNAWPTMTVVGQTRGDIGRQHSDALVEIVRRTAPGLPTTPVRTMQSVMDGSVEWRASFMRLVLVFASLGLLLAIVGVYSVLVFVVARRVREIGIRMALGADRRSVVRLVLRQSLIPITIGLLIGGVSSIWSGRLLEDSLFETGPGDVIVTAAIVLIVLAAGLAASWVPAQRASRVDPATALRQD